MICCALCDSARGSSRAAPAALLLVLQSAGWLPLAALTTLCFSSHPDLLLWTVLLQGTIRQASSLLQATRQLEVITEQLPSSQHIATSKGCSLAEHHSMTALAR
jgi:hypothetical protein